MADLVGRHGRSGRRFAGLVASVGADEWHNGTPCSEWDVRALVHHVLSEAIVGSLLLEGMTVAQVGDRFEGDVMGDDPTSWPGLFEESMRQAHAAVAQPGVLERRVHLSYGEDSAQEYVMQLTADLAIHSWDLARATDKDSSLDPDVVALLLPWTETASTNGPRWASSLRESSPARMPRTTYVSWASWVARPDRAVDGRGPNPAPAHRGTSGPLRLCVPAVYRPPGLWSGAVSGCKPCASRRAHSASASHRS